MKRWVKNPYYEHIKNGYKVQVTRGEGTPDEVVVREYYVSAEEIAERNKLHQAHEAKYNQRVQY